MAYLYNIPNSTTADQILVDVVTEVPGLSAMLLLFIYFLVFLGGTFRQKLRTGSADYSLWSTIGAIVTFVTALFMTMVSGVLGLDTLIIVVAVVIFSGAWLFFDRRGTDI